MSSQELGLDYPVKVPDEFSASFTKLLAFIKESRAEFAALRAEMQRLGVRPTKELTAEAQARKQAASAARQQEKDTRSAAAAANRAALDQVRAQKQAAQLTSANAQALTAQARAAAAAAAATNAQATAQANAARTSSQATAAQARAQAAATRATQAQATAAAAAGRAAQVSGRAATQGFQGAAAAAADAESATSRWLFTFRRLVGVFAIFQGVRFAIGAVKETIADAINFNATLEDTTLGIASLLVSVGQVRDAFGRTLQPVEQLALAQVEAQRQVRLLRVEALKTSATFKGLAETFQIAVGPGLAAGLTLEEIRKLTVRVSQSAASLGLPQNQLPEEIRSLLSGTIQQRTTRIASALGITNEDIRLAKEAGTLAEFLEKKFKAFSVAAEQSSFNFTVILSNLKDGFEQLIGQGSVPFFLELKDLLKDLQGVLVSVTQSGVDINPQSAAVVAAIASGLTTAVQQARLLVKELGPENLLKIAQAFGNIIGAASHVVVFAIETLTEFASGVAFVINVISDIVSFVKPIGAAIAGIAGFTLKWYLTTKLLSSVFSLIGSTLTKIAPLFFTLIGAGQVGGAGGLAFTFGELVKSVGAVGIAAGVLVAIAPLIASAFTKAGDEAARAATEVKTMGAVLDQIPSIVETANQPLRDNGDLLKKLTEELNKSLDHLRDTIATVGVKGSGAEDIKTLLAVENQLRDQGKELLSELNVKEKERLGLLSNIAKRHEQIEGLTKFEQESFAKLLPLYREARELRDRQLVLEQEIKTAVGSQQSKLQLELSGVLNKLEAIGQATQNLGTDSINKILGDPTKGVESIEKFRKIEKEVQDLVTDELVTKGQLVAADARLADLTAQRRLLVAEIAEIQINKVLASGLEEEASQKRRLLSERALLAAQRIRIASARADEAAGFNRTEGTRGIATAQAEQVIARQKLTELAAEQRLEEAAVQRAIDILGLREADLRVTRDAATIDADRVKAQEALDAAGEARVALERKLGLLQDANRAQLETERLRGNQILLDALATIRKTSAVETQAASEKVAAANLALDADKGRLAILDTEASRRFKVADSERQILELQADLGPAKARILLSRQQQLIGERELENEVQSLKTLKLRTEADVEFASSAEDSVVSLEELAAINKTLLASEERLASLRKQNAADLGGQTSRDLVQQRTALTQIAKQAEQERLAADNRLRSAQATLALEKQRSAILKLDADTGFRLSDSAKKLLEIDADTTAAQTRLDLARETQDIQEKGIEGTIAASKAFEAELRARAQFGTNAKDLAATESLITSTVAARIGLEAQLGKVRAANAADLAVELEKLRSNNLELQASISSEAVRDVRNLSGTTKTQEADTAAERARIDAIGGRLLVEQSGEHLRIEEKIKLAQADLGPINAQIAAQKVLNEEKLKELDTTITVEHARLNTDQTALKNAKPEDAAPIQVRIQATQQAINTLEAQRTALIANNNAGIDAQSQKLDVATRKLEELKLIAESPVELGIKQGFENFADKALDSFTNFTKLAEEAMDGLASTITDSLIDAFNPDKTTTIQDRFKQFFAGLARELAQMILKAQIAKAAVSLGLADGGEVPDAKGTGRVRGGYVPHHAMASLAHAHVRARGYAHGTRIRPRGLDPRDTVPIWAQPGEWMIRLASVRMYGENAMRAINEGRVEPSALRAVTDGARGAVSGAVPVARIGYAAGGSVAGGDSSQPQQQLVAAVVATEENYARLIRGGKRAHLEFMAEERDAIKTALRLS